MNVQKLEAAKLSRIYKKLGLCDFHKILEILLSFLVNIKLFWAKKRVF